MSDIDEVGYQRINEGYYEPPKDEVPQESPEDWSQIEQIKGIGAKTISDLQDIYGSVENLKLAVSNNRVPIRDDQAEKLKQYFIELEGGRIDG